ncbi:MAG: 2,3-bisphosphoglycerate-independent phosphoglycerate mutase, partial [Candidatus Binatia bacterium]
MKCVVVLTCGLADEPIPDLGGRTPLEAARTPNLDAMASRGILGLTRTIPRGAPPACNIAGLALLGYDPTQYGVGAAALEALGLGVPLGPDDVALRANLVTLDVTEDGTEILGDPLGGRLPAAEAAEVARHLASTLGGGEIELVPGVGHRHVLVWHGGEHGLKTVSPYELVDKPIAAARPTGPRSDALVAFMERARAALASHPICAARRARAERVPTGLWVWHAARAFTLPPLRDAFGVDGGIVAAAPLGQGLGIAVGLESIRVPGATADLDTNLVGKADAALRVLGERDLAVVHVAAADVAGHAGDVQRKLGVIERIDEQLIGRLLEGLRHGGTDWRVLVAADHATACATRLHTTEPVPFVVYANRDEAKPRGQKRGCSEKDAREQGIFIQE